jgi:hypothetical protein
VIDEIGSVDHGTTQTDFAQPVRGVPPTRRQRPTATGAVPETAGRPPSP